MAGAIRDYTYLYAHTSGVEDLGKGLGLHLATCDARKEHPYFFEGHMRHPRDVAQLLLVLSEVVGTHFFKPVPRNLDPVVTSNEAMLRFEGFSDCCGVYARADVPAESFKTELMERGTTNVDFNTPMRNALARLRDSDDVRLAVGRDAVAIEKAGTEVIEKKVKLPVRWVKCFSEVQQYQPGLSLRYELPAAEARRFVRGLPKNSPKRPCYLTQTGRTFRLTQRSGPGTVQFSGTHRVKVLEPLMPLIESLRVWYDDTTGVSAWEPVLKSGRFFLLLSPELYRGLSGEGQALQQLATGAWEKHLAKVQASLRWQNELHAADLAEELGLPQADIEAALTALGARGLAGYDVHQGFFFHRELPFDLGKVEQQQPRLKGARKLLDEDKVTILTRHDDGGIDVEVIGTDVAHFIRLRDEGDKCTCPWYGKHQGQRGPCKHVLAARMKAGEE